jgi:hypothetical protein
VESLKAEAGGFRIPLEVSCGVMGSGMTDGCI